MTDSGIVHVIDDDEAMRDSLAFLLDVQGFTPKLYHSAVAFLDVAAEAPPGCIVTDIRMPDMSGLELVHRLNAHSVRSPIIVMTGHGDVPLAVEAMKAGVVDFIEKPFSNDVFLAAVKAACARLHQGEDDGQARHDAVERLSHLSPRERDVLLGVVAGKANKVIARDLDISPRTVEIYRANLMTKVGARNISELMRIALAAGL